MNNAAEFEHPESRRLLRQKAHLISPPLTVREMATDRIARIIKVGEGGLVNVQWFDGKVERGLRPQRFTTALYPTGGDGGAGSGDDGG